MPPAQRRARFRALHATEQLFVMPNPWDVGSACLLASFGFEALATTSAGFAWSIARGSAARNTALPSAHRSALNSVAP
jgi:2-methylisocitrate lyase-like PEP mutase family enzyme